MDIIKIFTEIYNWIKDKIFSEDVTIENSDMFHENMYDVYYHFKLAEKDCRLGYITLSDFNYPDSFTIELPKTCYKIRVFKKGNMIYSSVYYNGQIINTYNEYTYNSLEHLVHNTNMLARLTFD